MTVSTTSRRSAQVGNGVSLAFTIPFKFIRNSDVAVYVDGVLQSSGVTITGAGAATGTATFAVAPANLASVVLVGAQVNDQQTVIAPNGPFPARSVETMGDKAMIGVQQVADTVQLAIRAPDGDASTLDSLPLAAARAGYMLGFAAGSGQPEVSTFTMTQVESAVAAAYAGAVGPLDALSFIQAGTGAVSRTAQDKVRESVSVFDFMTAAQIADAKARTFAVDMTAAIQAARDYIATNRLRLVFPPGGYSYSVSPNWAINHAQVVFEGDVTLRYTGTGNAVIFDAEAADAVVHVAGLLYSTMWGWGNRPTIEAPASAGHGVYCRSTHHCKIGARVRGAGSTSAGLLVQFAVCSEFDVVVSGNQDGWYAKPKYGMILDRRGAGGDTTSYCTFWNPIIEGPQIGIYLLFTLGNSFIGGTAEACTQYGVAASPNASQDKFYGTDFEVNTTADVYDLGTGLILDNCDSYTLVTLGITSRNATIRGGRYSQVALDIGCLRATVKDMAYNRFNDGSILSDGGTATLLENCRNVGSATTYLTGLLAVGAVVVNNGALGTTSITVTGAKLGDFVQVAFDAGGLGSMIQWCAVTALNTVTAYAYNNTGAPVNVPAGNWRAWVSRR